jgi:hypothetical protein
MRPYSRVYAYFKSTADTWRARSTYQGLDAMPRHKPRIGWYCPFALPVLGRSEYIELVQVVSHNFHNGTVGALKLCRKMTAAWELLHRRSVDALVLSDCCNLSHWMYDFFTIENPEIPIHRMMIYRKVSSFSSRILEEWDALKSWLDMFNCRWLEQEGVQGVTWDDAPSSLPEQGTESVDIQPGTPWCTLPKEEWERIKQGPPHQVVESLLENVCCPRLIDDNCNLPVYAFYKENSRALEDSCDQECVPQNYFLNIFRSYLKA